MFKLRGVMRRAPPRPPPPPPRISTPSFMLNKNIPLLPDEVDSNTVYVPPVHPLDLTPALNSIPSTKTIIHVLKHTVGMADYLRGSILLAQYAKHYQLQFKLNVSQHEIRSCLECNDDMEPPSTVHEMITTHKNTGLNQHINSLIQQCIQSSDTTLCVYTNLFYDRELLTNDIKHYINSFFTFKPHYYHDMSRLFPLKSYEVLHIRCPDSEFATSFNDNNLLAEIIKLQLPVNTIVISNNYHLKQKLHRLFGFYYIDIQAEHSAYTRNSDNLYSTIIDYIVLAKSSRTHCLSYYGHGSGFSEQCSILNDVPYSVRFLPEVYPLIKENLDLLFNYYDSLEYIPKPVPRLTRDPVRLISVVHDEVKFVLNSIQSLKTMNMPTMHVYCIGEEVYFNLKPHVPCEFIPHKKSCDFSWSVVYHKYEIIYKNLLDHPYVCISSPDIVYTNQQLFLYASSIINDNDIVFSSESIHTSSVTTAWMFIRSNEATRAFFHPNNLTKYQHKESWNESVYLNEIKYNLKFKKIPLLLCPTAGYYLEYNPKSPYFINFEQPLDKREKQYTMMKCRQWHTLHKVNVEQVHSTSFFHYLEGVLRLVSLHLQLHATYYTSTLPYSTELSAYLNQCLHIFPTRTSSMTSTMNESRSFHDVLMDKEVDSTLYYYDGVHNHSLPNMKLDTFFETCIPSLKEIFLPGLPPPYYAHGGLHVVCHLHVYHEATLQLLQKLQQCNQYNILLYTDLKVDMLSQERLHVQNTSNELQMLSNSIHADIIIMTYTSLMIVAHILGDSSQQVICPYTDNSFSHRLLNKCVYIKNVL